MTTHFVALWEHNKSWNATRALNWIFSPWRINISLFGLAHTLSFVQKFQKFKNSPKLHLWTDLHNSACKWKILDDTTILYSLFTLFMPMKSYYDVIKSLKIQNLLWRHTICHMGRMKTTPPPGKPPNLKDVNMPRVKGETRKKIRGKIGTFLYSQLPASCHTSYREDQVVQDHIW